MSRFDEMCKFCCTKQDVKEAIDIMAYYGVCDFVKDSSKVSAVASSNAKFVFEYENEDGEDITVEFTHIWVQDYSDTIILDGDRYSAELLLDKFGGVYFHPLYL